MAREALGFCQYCDELHDTHVACTGYMLYQHFRYARMKSKLDKQLRRIETKAFFCFVGAVLVLAWRAF